MCTALSLKTQDHYFGRNLDLDRSYGEEVCIMPRNYPIKLRQIEEIKHHYAMIGMATVALDVPLFYEAANEHGLAMAGLNFPGNACYHPVSLGKDNIAPFELIPWILGRCKNIAEARELINRLCLVNIPFSSSLPLSPLHWMISDKNSSLVLESMKDGLHVHESNLGVLSNNPPYEYHLENLKNYSHLKTDNSGVVRDDSLGYVSYCQGLGAVGLPGDVSSMSRFVRIAFAKENSVCDSSESSSVGQFFHLLSFVEMPRGICKTDEGTLDITGYSACINTDKGLYYYTTYNNRRISCVDMHKEELEGDKISRYPLKDEQSIFYVN